MVKVAKRNLCLYYCQFTCGYERDNSNGIKSNVPKIGEIVTWFTYIILLPRCYINHLLIQLFSRTCCDIDVAPSFKNSRFCIFGARSRLEIKKTEIQAKPTRILVLLTLQYDFMNSGLSIYNCPLDNA